MIDEKPPTTPPAHTVSRRVGRPQLFQGSRERHSSWLECFFDLVFVVAVAELANLLHRDLSLSGLGYFAALFVPVWWQWIDFSYYADQFETDALPSQIVTFFVMFGVIVMALSLQQVPKGGSWQFGAIYAALRIVIIGLYGWAWRHVPQSRDLTARYTTNFTVALIVWCVSLLIPEPLRYLLWAVALTIEIGNGPLTYATIKNVPAQVSHMDERFGLFVIIVLGEAVVSVATGVAGTVWQASTLLTAFGGFVIAAGMWRMYFVCADSDFINQALRGDKHALLRSYLYGYSHFLLFLGVTAASVGIQVAIETAVAHTIPLVGRTALGGGVAVFLIGAGIVQWSTPRSLPLPLLTCRFGVGTICLLLAFAGSLTPLLLTLLIMLLLVGVLVFEAVYCRHRQES